METAMRLLLFTLALAAGWFWSVSGSTEELGKSPYVAWKNGVPSSGDFFPIAVWLQSPAAAPKYKAAGINVYVGLWRGPTEPQLEELKKHGMRVICAQNEVGLKHKDDPTIVGWMHGDEPDNAQSLGKGKGYGPPVPAARIIDDFKKLQAADQSRPILLNLGQGVAWDGWVGRGVRTNHPEDYLEYVKACDIASFDIYPACHKNRAVAGKLWMVADGVSRLRKWSGDRKIVWNCIECTHIDNPNTKATPRQVKAEVWMSLVRGSRGLIYFVHQFQPKFIEAGLFADADMLAQVTQINQQIHRLTPILNRASIVDGVAVESSSPEVPVEAMRKRDTGADYVFAVGMRDGKTNATFRLAGMKGKARAEVIDEKRLLEVRDGAFRDTFEAWDVHLYKIVAE
jgi:hypothetical protein